MPGFEFQTRTRIVFGEGSLARLGELASELGFRRTLVVADRGVSGYAGQACEVMQSAGIEPSWFFAFDANPDSAMVEAGRDFAVAKAVDSIVGLGGGSSMDCAKGINFLLTNGGEMRDFWGWAKAAKSMLPSIGIPTTAGTGSEAQSYALISDARTHAKMACGDPKAAFRIAILDPCLTVSQPRQVKATAGYDAISHAVETWVTTKRNPVSEIFAREAWRLLDRNYERALEDGAGVDALGAMLLGSHLAGLAIENSMLGATHACANPLTAHYGTVHGLAIAALLPHVVRWNRPAVGNRYDELSPLLPERLERLAAAGGLPRGLASLGVPESELPLLSREAAAQWTGRFNPRPFDAAAALEVYRCAY
jgi:alcohol dehydrogenase